MNLKAAVVTGPGEAVTGPDLAAWCRDRLAGYKRPRLIEWLRSEDIPRNAVGKVLRSELAERPATPEQRV